MSGSTSLPTITADSAAVTEDGTLAATGNILANDSDNNGRTLTVASVNGTAVTGATTIPGTYGTLVIQPNGSYTYTLNNTSAPVRSLRNGQTLPDLFTYVASDGQTYTQAVTQTVQNLVKQSEAFNDASWVAYGTAPTVTANTSPGPAGTASTADRVALGSRNSGLYFQTAVSGQHTFSVWVRLVSGDGNLSLGYYSGNAGTVTAQAALATGAWQRVSFTFSGDANAFSNVSLGHGSAQAANGTFEFWGAQLNPGAAAAPYVPTAGAPVTTTVTTTANAVLSSALTVNVTGNTPVGNPDTAAVVENGQLTASGTVLANDTDGPGKTLAVASVNGIAVNGPTAVTGTYGVLTIQGNGQYTYTLSNTQANVQALANGQVVQDPFSYVLSDGNIYLQASTQTVQNLVTQSEAFDAAVWVGFAASGASPTVAANKDPGPNGGAATADQVTFTGANSGLYFQTPVQGQSTFSVWVRLTSGSGSFAFGYYSGSSNSVAQQAAVATAAWQRLSWTFTGDGNAFSNLSLMHGNGQSTTGTLEFWGAQLNAGATAQTYVPTAGAPASTTTTTTANATPGSILGVSVTGASASAPPVAAPDTATVIEDSATQTAAGNVLANDTAFGGRSLRVVSVNGTAVSGATSVTGTYGTLVIQPNGQYGYTLANSQPNVRLLSNGQVVPDLFTYAVTDGLTSSQTTTQVSQNFVTRSEAFDASPWAVFSATGLPGTVVTGNVGAGPSGGAATADQLDLLGPSAGIYYRTAVSGQNTFSVWVRLLSGNPNFSFNSYSGSADTSALQAAVATSSWQRLSWTFNGDGNGNSNVAIMHGPLQSGDTVLELWGAQLNSGAAPGTYVPTAGAAVNTTSSVTAPIGSALTVSVKGVTPAAATDTSSVTAGGTVTASGNLLANDTDANGLPLAVAAVNGTAVAATGSTTVTGTYGALVVQADGRYAYTLANSQANVQALAGGQVVTDNFSYATTDGLVHTQATNQTAQNLITQSEAFDSAPWGKFSPGALPVVTANVGTGPSGGAGTADRVALTVQNSGLFYPAANPGPYTFGVWAKLVSGSGAFSFSYFDTSTGSNYLQAATATAGWQHFTFGFSGDGNANSALALQLGADQAGGTFEFWGAQLNPGTTLNSYVPTSGTGVTVSTSVTSAAAIGSVLSVSVGGTDAGKAGPALNLQSATQGIVANLATGLWSTATTVMPLGDSITYGWGAQDAQNQNLNSEGYRGPLWSQFLAGNAKISMVGDQSNGLPTLLDPLNAGYPGERSDQIEARLPGLLATQRPNDILLMAGINDLKQGFTPASVGSNIAAMLSLIAGASPLTQTYVATITPVATNIVSTANLSAANTAITSAVQAARSSGIKVKLVDTSNVTLADISADGVHPAPGGYSKLAQDWYAAITAQQPLAGGTPGGTATAISPTTVNLVGGSGNDLLVGDTRANFITGGAGNDILIGGGGNDVLTGGAGADILGFTAAGGQVTVNDFNPGEGDYLDWINIPGLSSTVNLAGHVTQSGGATLVDLSSFVPNLGVKLLGYTGDLSHSIFGPPSG